jgi:mono/diheme cytochrome c family protein
MELRVRPWGLGALAFAVAAAAGVPAALGSSRAKPKVIGNWKLGKPAFQTTCGVCHRLKAAGTVGTNGPNLDRTHLSQTTIIKAITFGGATVMTKAAAARYTTEMTPYKDALTASQINDISAFVYVATHTKPPT